jgi:hypothetical protein
LPLSAIAHQNQGGLRRFSEHLLHRCKQIVDTLLLHEAAYTQDPNRVAVPLADSPGPPSGVGIAYVETAMTIGWSEPPGTFRRAQRPAEPGELEARSLAPTVIPTTYNVYKVGRTAGTAAASPQLVNPTPVEGRNFTQYGIRLGEEACYQVRAVRVYGSARLESVPSETVCTTFVDTFPPPAPTRRAP